MHNSNFGLNYKALFDSYGIRHKDTVNKGWVNINCPICKIKDTHFNGGFKDHSYNCWRCGKHNYLYILSLVLKKEKSQVIKILQNYTSETKTKYVKKYYKSSLWFDFPELTLDDMMYLHCRGVNVKEAMNKYGFRTGVGKWQGRIIIPIIFNNEIVSYVGRSINLDEKIRYMNLKNGEGKCNIKEVLYNYDNCNSNYVCVVEGVFDAIKMGDNFVATLGTQFTNSQLSLLARFDRVIVLFDNEVDAQNKAKLLVEKLHNMGVNAEHYNLLSYYNKNDYGELNNLEVKSIKEKINTIVNL